MHCLGPDAAVLLHAEAAECRDGEPEGEEGVPYLRENFVRQINMEQAYADSHWSVLFFLRFWFCTLYLLVCRMYTVQGYSQRMRLQQDYFTEVIRSFFLDFWFPSAVYLLISLRN